MNIVKVGAGVVAGAIVLVLAVAAMQPDHVHIERSKVVKAEPRDVFPYVNDLRQWVMWNPWAEKDPKQKVEFSANSAGVGAWYTWEGDVTGQGKMSIKASKEPETVQEDLEFIKPFTAKADVAFTLTQADGGTKVTWTYDANADLIAKVFGLFTNMDKMLGGDFEHGLDKLAPMAEEAAKKRQEAEAKRAAEEEAARQAAAAAAAAAL
ncbi:MAG TPA: SRPBCC family protein, partial [Myxococcota bacterium]|nr:SRPBCC family protein [Myxococcota bacterium]